MLGDFWSELLGSVGALLNGLTRNTDREFVFVDNTDANMPMPDVAGELAQAPAPSAPPMWVQARAQLETLQKADPAFLESTFLTQAAKTYAAALGAEGSMNADDVSAVVTPAFATALAARISGWRSSGCTRIVSDVSLDAPTTLKVAIGGAAQAITVRFTGSAKRYTKDDMTNLVTEGSAQSQSFTEFATFTRPAGSTTPQAAANGAPLHCPSCGAPVDAGALKCAYCGASLSGTGGTWLLDHTSVSAYT
ncbi:MAG: zinc-ribbon domain-containing transport protein [Candidatus Eremiobacteraeota bacterium]|nr:zinc-ribbon domain-containing transport protein [Candidatus Eremiobacteraeota bacterium]